MLKQFKENGITILDIFHCPHGPDSTCNCRKPQPGMFLQAHDKYDIDMCNSWMIGDKEADTKAANSAGINNTILVRTGHLIDEANSNASYILDSVQQTKQLITG